MNRQSVQVERQLIEFVYNNTNYGCDKEITNDLITSDIADPPVVWGRLATGYRIEDLKEDYFLDVIDMLKKHYIPYEVLAKSTNLNNEDSSYESYMNELVFHLWGMTSVIAIDENYTGNNIEAIKKIQKEKQTKKKIVGALILRVIDKIDYGRTFSRVGMVEGDAIKKCVELRAHLSKKVDLFARFNCVRILRYYDLCVLPEYRGNGIGRFMMKCGYNVAKALKTPIVMGLFTSFSLQNLAAEIGLTVLYEVKYANWKNTHGELIFTNTGYKNHSCAFMAGRVPYPVITQNDTAKTPLTPKSGSSRKKEKKGKKK